MQNHWASPCGIRIFSGRRLVDNYQTDRRYRNCFNRANTERLETNELMGKR